MKKILFIPSLLILLIAVSCSADDELGRIDDIVCEVPPSAVVTNEKNYEENGTYHVLILGNSLSRDAFSYVPALVSNVCPNIRFEMDIFYKGSVGLGAHLSSIEDGVMDHTLDHYGIGASHWVSTSGADGSKLLDSQEWDVVVIQEGNVKLRGYETVEGYAIHACELIRSRQPNCKIAYMMVPAQPEGSSVLGDFTSDEVWQMFANTSRQVVENLDVDEMIPCGTAIQNARHTRLDALGSYGHLSYDGVHLQEGMPCLTDALAATQSLFDMLGIDASIKAHDLEITNKWISSQNIPGQHGSAIEGCGEAYLLATECALQAIVHPYELTFIE